MKEFEEYKSTKVRFTSEKNNKQSRQYEPLSITHKNTALEYIYYQNFSSPQMSVFLDEWIKPLKLIRYILTTFTTLLLIPAYFFHISLIKQTDVNQGLKLSCQLLNQ